MPLSFDEIIEFAHQATRGMAMSLQQMVPMMREDPETSAEQRVAYARILREQAELCLAAAEELERE